MGLKNSFSITIRKVLFFCESKVLTAHEFIPQPMLVSTTHEDCLTEYCTLDSPLNPNYTRKDTLTWRESISSGLPPRVVGRFVFNLFAVVYDYISIVNLAYFRRVQSLWMWAILYCEPPPGEGANSTRGQARRKTLFFCEPKPPPAEASNIKLLTSTGFELA